MEERMFKLISRKGNVILKGIPGPCATSTSHVNYYLDMTTLQSRQSEAEEAARVLVTQYISSTVVDTILCLDGTQIIGAYLAQELNRSGFMSINAHQTIYVISPEYDSFGQMIFRDNLVPMVQGKDVLILISTVNSGISVRRVLECVAYYGGTVQGVATVFSVLDKVDNVPIYSLFTPQDIPGYTTQRPEECAMCRAGKRIDALANSYGISKL